MSLKCHTVAPRDHHTHTVVLLHDHGSNGRDFLVEIMESRTGSLADSFPGVRWVFPNARALWSSRTSDDFRQWFNWNRGEEVSELQQDITSQELKESVKLVTWVVEDEAAAIGSEHVFLGEACQGCTVAFRALLSHGKRLGGFLVTAVWCGPQEEQPSWRRNDAIRTSALLECSPRDTELLPWWAEEFGVVLANLGMCVERVLHEGDRAKLVKGWLHQHESIGRLLHRAMEK